MVRINDSKYMQRDPLLYGILGFLIGAIVVWIIISSSVNTNNLGLMRMMGMQYLGNTIQSSNSIDAHFMEQMIPHHEDAIIMSELALKKASRQEVKDLAQDIIDSQSKEIEKMKKWYKEWFGKDLPTGSEVMNVHGMMSARGMHMGMMGDASDIERLETIDNFDKAFLEEMIPHHQMAVMMASMLKGGTNRSEMRQLADDIITSQTNEIDKMREWLKKWE